MLSVPSGAAYNDQDLRIVRRMAEVGFLAYSEEPFILKSGIPSHIYVSGRDDLTTNPDLLWTIGRKIAKTVQRLSDSKRTPVLIGIPFAGQPLASAGSLVSYRDSLLAKNGMPIGCKLMRAERKTHGAHTTWVDGGCRRDDLHVLLDNVMTNGQSKLEARQRLREDGLSEGAELVVLVDRQQGGMQRVLGEFSRVTVLYHLLDLTFALGELDYWPKSLVGAVEEEIRGHQFL